MANNMDNWQLSSIGHAVAGKKPNKRINLITSSCCVKQGMLQKMVNDYYLGLPQGKTCKDCANFRRCREIYGHKGTDTYCDFYPVQFKDITGIKNKTE